MKIYYTQSSALSTKLQEDFSNFFKQKNHTVVARQRPSDQEKMDFHEAEKLFLSNNKNLRNADIIVAECSYVSNDVGYEVSLAIQYKKPVIALYNMSENSDHPRHIKNVPVGLKGNKNKYLMLRGYEHSTLEKTLELAIKDAKSLADTKFILIIPAEIDRYLEWNVREKGVSKAEITRDSIEKVMNSDEAYTKYLKDNGIEE